MKQYSYLKIILKTKHLEFETTLKMKHIFKKSQNLPSIGHFSLSHCKENIAFNEISSISDLFFYFNSARGFIEVNISKEQGEREKHTHTALSNLSLNILIYISGQHKLPSLCFLVFFALL